MAINKIKAVKKIKRSEAVENLDIYLKARAKKEALERGKEFLAYSQADKEMKKAKEKLIEFCEVNGKMTQVGDEKQISANLNGKIVMVTLKQFEGYTVTPGERKIFTVVDAW